VRIKQITSRHCHVRDLIRPAPQARPVAPDPGRAGASFYQLRARAEVAAAAQGIQIVPLLH